MASRWFEQRLFRVAQLTADREWPLCGVASDVTNYRFWPIAARYRATRPKFGLLEAITMVRINGLRHGIVN
jgi:hypothetical protein